jgi:hypothetical protein
MSSPQPIEGPGDYVIRFGAHKNRKLRDLPIGYISWLLTLEGLRDPLRSHIHDLIRELYRAAGGEDVGGLFVSEPGADAKPPARLAK